MLLDAFNYGKTQARFGHLFSSLFCSEFSRKRSKKKLVNLMLSVEDFALDQQGMNDCTLLNVGSATLLFSQQPFVELLNGQFMFLVLSSNLVANRINN